MNNNIEISVVIPTFNREKTINRCLKSVLQQTFAPIEIIVVDDGSEDKTKAIIEGIADHRIRYIPLGRQNGAQAARNRGIKEACGNWIAFQDSDDVWIENKLEMQVNALSKENFDPLIVVYTNSSQVNVDNGKTHQKKKPALKKKKPVLTGKNAYTSLLTDFGPMFQGMLVSKIALQKIGYLDENLPSWQEWDTSIRLAKYCRFVYIDEPLFVYYRQKTGAISSDRKKDITGYQYVITKFEKDIKKFCGNAIWEKHLIYLFKNCLELYLWRKSCSYIKQISSKRTILKIIINYIYFKLTTMISQKLNFRKYQEPKVNQNSRT